MTASKHVFHRHTKSDLPLVVRVGVEHGEVEKIRRHGRAPRRKDLQRQFASAVENRRTGFPDARHYVATPGAPFGKRLDDPLRALE